MHKLLGVLCLLALSLWPLPIPSTSQTRGYAGAWQQLASNAGPCDRCRVTLVPHGSTFLVKANNGWSAIVEPLKPVDDGLTGVGRWDPDASKAYRGRQFSIHLLLIEGRLYMSMRLRMADGTPRAVQAIFDRVGIPPPEPQSPTTA